MATVFFCLICCFITYYFTKRSSVEFIDYGPSLKFLGEDFFRIKKNFYQHKEQNVMIAYHPTKGQLFFSIDKEPISSDDALVRLAPFNFLIENPETWTDEPHPVTDRWSVYTHHGMYCTMFEGNKQIPELTNKMIWPPVKYQKTIN